jgi:hypothetical protein
MDLHPYDIVCHDKVWEYNKDKRKKRKEEKKGERQKVTRSQVPCRPTWGSKYAAMRKQLEFGAAP